MTTRPSLEGVGAGLPRPYLGWQGVMRLIVFALVLSLALAGTLTFQLLPTRYQFNEGDVSPYNIRSPVKITYTSRILTKAEQDRAEAAVAEVYELDSGAALAQRGRAAAVLRQIGHARAAESTWEQKRQAIRSLPEFGPGAPWTEELFILDDASWLRVVAETLRVLGEVMRVRFSRNEVPAMKESVPTLVSGELSEKERETVTELVKIFLKPTLIPNPELTAQRQRQAREAVPPVRVAVEKGEMVLREGDIVRATDLEKLEAVSLHKPLPNWQDLSGAGLLVLLLVATLSFYMYLFQSSVLISLRRTLLVVLVVALAVLAAKLTIPGRDLYAYLFPVAAVGMLLATLLDAHLAIVVVALLSVVIGVLGGYSLPLAVVSLAGSLAGLLVVWRRERLHAFFWAGLAVAAANFTVIAAFQLLAREADVGRLAILAVVSLANGILSAALTLGTHSILGLIFGITTPLGLLELASLSQPLLRRLMVEAPGTYHHSLIVANLSERAAQQTGADSLLTRVGAYYHDIGKIAQPQAFIENQLQGVNIHDQLSPEASAQLVAAHITDGLSLARQYRLPAKIREFIPQHHGTRLISYFYHRASQNGEAADLERFRYQGPRPQSRETAIVMLADMVEGLVRSNQGRSPENIAQLIERAVNEALAEGQLDEADLTLRDLAIIKRAFAEVLQGIYHPRIAYPQVPAAPPVAPADGA